MSIRGPAPKPDDERLRRNKPTFEEVNLRWDGLTRGPELPDEMRWCVRTQKWWDNWRNSPQAMIMDEVDWDYMLDTALLHNMMWMPSARQGGAVSMTQLAAQIKARSESFGASFESRRKLRMEINGDSKREAEAVDREVVKTVNYAERLIKKAAEAKEKNNE